MQKQGTFKHIFEDAQRKHSYFVNQLQKKIDQKLVRYEGKALQSAEVAGKKLGKSVKKTFGLAEAVSPPVAPSAIPSPELPMPPRELPPVSPVSLPPPIGSPETPPMPIKPPLLSEPTIPANRSFIPKNEPTLAPAQSIADVTGDLLEKNLMGGKGIANNPLTKLAGLKYLFGKAAIPAEAAYAAMKVLTSPTEVGQVARMTFKQAGIEAINSWAQRYPSYHDGILENPQERRSLTKEIEDDPEIPIEQKALIQSQVNRGKSINQMNYQIKNPLQ
jgi:hypothetical protein